MPFLAAAILGALIQGAATLVGRVLIALGVGFVTYGGISVLIDSIKADIITKFHALPAEMIQILSVLEVDTAITMIFSAIAARLVLMGLTSGTLKKMVLK